MNSFRNRLLAAAFALIVLVQGATTFALLARARSQLLATAAANMQGRADALRKVMAVRYEVAATSLAALTREQSFGAALAARDPEALAPLLAAQSTALRAQFTTLSDESGRPIVPATGLSGAALEELSNALRVASSGQHVEIHTQAGTTTRELFAVLGSRSYRLVVVPARTHERTSWLAAGFALTDETAVGLKDFSGLDVSYLTHAADGKTYLASTLPRELRPRLYSIPLAGLDAVAPQLVDLGGEPYFFALLPLDSATGAIRAVVQLPMRDTTARFERLRLEMLVISIAALAVAALIALFASRRALRPIDALVLAAQRIEQGHYGEKVVVRGGKEFERLAAVFDSMQRRIAEREARIVHQARHDQLTGLPNRLAARAKLSRLLGERVPVGLVLLDLRGFKHLNASFGHELGDQVLREIARRLSGAVRLDDCAAHLGADQFLLLLRGSGVEHSMATAAQIVRGVRQGVLLGAIEVNLDMHAGVCAAPEHGTEAEELLRRADIALQEAKASGTAVCRYETGRDETYRKRLRLLTDLHAAVLADQLSLVYQPKVQMGDRRVRSLEALVRWTHPQLGPIPPADFVPLAEQTGAIGELTRWVLRNAIAQLAKWRAAGLDSELAINLSASDLSDAELPEEILGLLARNDVLPRQLQLEITESVVMRELDKAVRVMRRLREAGIRFAIDDFGTGHSSLAQLKALPVDELKIDRSFVRDLEQGTRDDAIVRSAVELSHSLGLKVVAEGIETPAAWTALLRLGCDYAQGYFISRPMPPEQVVSWIHEANARLAGAESGTAQVRVLTELRGARR